MKHKIILLTLAIICIAVTGISVFGQSVRGRIEGTIKDAQGQVVPNVTLKITSAETGETLQATSTEEGTFAVAEVKPGTYQITAEATGFKTTSVSNVVVQVATVSGVNIDLEVGAVSEQVTVDAQEAQEVVNTTTPEVGDVVDRQRILDLPLDGRNPFELTALQAGVSTKTNSDGEVSKFSINGNRTVANNLTVDGVNASDNFLKTPANITLPVIPVSVESIGEFRVTTSLPTAEFGRGTSQINAITASGTNQYRGSLFLFHRNTVFNANTFFNNSTILENGSNVAREPLIRNQFGGRFSGPLPFFNFGEGGDVFTSGKDRTFFFFSYEGKRESRGLSRNRLVYTAEARQGIFRYLRGRATTPANVALAPGSAPASVIAGIPAGTRTCATTGATALPTGTICIQNVFALSAGRTIADPVVASYLANVPTPNNFQIGDGLNTGGFRFNAKIISPSDQFSTRIDHRISDKHSLEGTFNHGIVSFLGDYINEGEEPFPNQPYRTRKTDGNGLSVTLRSILSPTIVNEARFGAQISSLEFGNTADFSEGYQIALSTIFNPEDTFVGSGRDLRVFQWTDNLTFVRGEHTFKAGIEVRKLSAKRFTFDATLPSVDFSTTNDPLFTQTTQFANSQTADFTAARVLANTLAGAIGSVTQTFNVTDRNSGFVRGAPEVREYSNTETNLYFQDSWRFRPNLTLSLGVRYEYNTTPREKNNLALLPVGGSAGLYGVSGDGNLFQPGVLEGSPTVLDFAPGGLFYKADRNNFAPVLGFAWDPFKDGKTSLRGGYRISYFQGSFNTIDGTLDDNEGLILTTTRAVNSGFLRNGFAEAPLPAVSIPALQTIQTNSIVDVRAFDEDLRTPYVHDYTFSIQREIFNKTSVEVRYVGNRGVKLYRGFDINEVNIFAKDPRGTGQTFIEAFRVAQNNLNACRAVAACAATPSFAFNAAIPGSVNNPLFQTIFAAQTTSYTLSNFTTRLDEGRAGDFIDYLLRLRILNNERGGTFLTAVRAGLLPLNFFRANPSIRGAQLFTNGSTSQYDSLQVELTRRLSRGLRVQANYTFAKGLSDFVGSTGDTNSFLTLTDTRREYAVYTNTHQLSANVIYQLPFGGKRGFFRNARGIAGFLVGGWQVGGIVRYISGDPLSITSGRGTYNTDARSASNTADVVGNLTRDELQALIGLQRNGNGVFFINPNLAPGSTSDASQVIFTNPRAGTIGSLGLSSFFGPRNFNVDFSVLKRTRIRENVNVEFRAEVFNALNTVNFDNPDLNINSATFGTISNTVGRPRLMQFALRLNF